MQQERKVIDPSTIIVFDRNVKVSELNGLLTENFNGDLIIHGDLFFDEELCVKCSLYVMENVICIPDQEINVEGDLYCGKEIAGYNISVKGFFYSEGTISADDIKVGESFWCKNRIEAYGGKISVCGDFECHGIKAKTVEAFGQIYMEGPIAIRKIMLGGYQA